jgi:hypothetical protein
VLCDVFAGCSVNGAQPDSITTGTRTLTRSTTNTTAPIDLAVEHPDVFTVDYEGSPAHFLSTTRAAAPIDIAVEHPMAINDETSSVAGSELSYVIQGMEMRLALQDMLNDDTIRLVHTFSRLVSPRV